MSVIQYVSHYVTAKDLGLAIRDALTDSEISAYDANREKIALSSEQVFSIDFNNPCNLIVEVPSGARFAIKIEQIKSAMAAKVQKELYLEPIREYGPRNV